MVFTVRNALGRSKSMVFTARIAHRTSKIAPGGPRGDLGRFGGLRGCSRDAPGGARRALATLPARLGTPPDAPGTPRSDQKASPGGPESICGSVLFGQSFARRSRNDFRTFLGPSGEVRTSILLRPASVLRGSSVFRRNARSTTKATEKGSEMVPRSPQIAPESRPGHVPDTRRAQFSAGRAIFWGSGTSAEGAQRRGSDSEAQLSARSPNAPGARQVL